MEFAKSKGLDGSEDSGVTEESVRTLRSEIDSPTNRHILPSRGALALSPAALAAGARAAYNVE
jgi:hypothetical protein